MSSLKRFREEAGRRWSVVWTFLKEHHAVVALLMTIAFGLFGSYISWRLSVITDNQRRMQELSVIPQLIFECPSSEHWDPPDTLGVDLVVQNVGGPLNRLTITLKSFMPLRISTPGHRDTAVAIVPLAQYFGPVTVTHHPQGIVAKGSAASANAGWSWTHARSTYDSTDIVVRPQRAHHLVHLAYSDGLQHRTERFVVLNEHDFWTVPERDGLALWDTLAARQSSGRVLYLESGMTKEAILAMGRAARSVARHDRALLHGVELAR